MFEELDKKLIKLSDTYKQKENKQIDDKKIQQLLQHTNAILIYKKPDGTIETIETTLISKELLLSLTINAILFTIVIIKILGW